MTPTLTRSTNKRPGAGNNPQKIRMARLAKVVLVALLSSLTPTAATAGSVVAAATTNFPPHATLVGLPPDQAEVVSEALRLFAAGGLNLPPIVFRASLDRADCHGDDGWYSANARRVQITLCTTQRDNRERHVVLHELAHAWTGFALSREGRAAFHALRGYTYWLDYRHATWRDNGGEQAADIIAWGLNDHIEPALAIDHNSCAELAAGYVALTGSSPLHGLTKICSAPRRPTVR